MRYRPGAAKREQLPEQIAPQLSGVLLCGLRRALRNEPIVKSAKVRLEAMGLVKKVPDRFSGLTPLGLEVLRISKASPTEETPS